MFHSRVVSFMLAVTGVQTSTVSFVMFYYWRVLKILPSFVSRITKAEVYARCSKLLLREKFLQFQLPLFSHVARLLNEDALQQCLTVRNDVRPVSFVFS